MNEVPVYPIKMYKRNETLAYLIKFTERIRIKMIRKDETNIKFPEEIDACLFNKI
jgi:hypothetical protein